MNMWLSCFLLLWSSICSQCSRPNVLFEGPFHYQSLFHSAGCKGPRGTSRRLEVEDPASLLPSLPPSWSEHQRENFSNCYADVIPFVLQIHPPIINSFLQIHLQTLKTVIFHCRKSNRADKQAEYQNWYSRINLASVFVSLVFSIIDFNS